MIKDRGTIKWTAMMLPEHVQQVREFWEDDKKVPKRSIDEQQLELINNVIQHATIKNLLVRITYYKNGYYLNKNVYVKKIDPLAGILSLLTPQGEKININTNHIVEVEQIV